MREIITELRSARGRARAARERCARKRALSPNDCAQLAALCPFLEGWESQRGCRQRALREGEKRFG